MRKLLGLSGVEMGLISLIRGAEPGKAVPLRIMPCVVSMSSRIFLDNISGLLYNLTPQLMVVEVGSLPLLFVE